MTGTDGSNLQIVPAPLLSGSSGQPTHRGIEIASVGAGTEVTVENNLFTGNNPYSYAGDDWRSAVYSNGGQGTTTIEDNTFENVRSAVNADNFSSTVQITGNVLDHDGSGVSIEVTSDVANVTSITNNTFGVNVDNEFNFSNLTTPVTFNATATANALSACRIRSDAVFLYRRWLGGRRSNGQQRQRHPTWRRRQQHATARFAATICSTGIARASTPPTLC